MKHPILPAAALSTVPMAIIARMTRASLIEVWPRINPDGARKGPDERVVVMQHASKTASFPSSP